MTALRHVTYTVEGLSDTTQNPCFFSYLFRRSVTMVSYSDQLLTLGDCILATAYICLLKNEATIRYTGKNNN